VSRNAVPIFGLAFLDWHAANLIVLYFVDFMADVGFILGLLMLLDPEFRTLMEIPPGPRGAVKMASAMLLVIGILLLTFGFVFGMPVFGMFVMETDLSLTGLLADARFRNGVLLQIALSSWTYIQAYRYFSRMRAADASYDFSPYVKSRFNYVLVRWLAVYAAGLFIPIFPAIMVVAYCVATVYIELFPRKVVEFLGPDKDEATPGSR
jgi:hypothetical protein